MVKPNSMNFDRHFYDLTGQLWRFGFLVISVLIFIYVLFIDFIPSAFGGYADQRVLLCFLLVLAPAACLLTLSYKKGVSYIIRDLMPLYVLLFAFFLGAFVFAETQFSLIESGLYLLYFLCFSLLGRTILVAGSLSFSINIFLVTVFSACFFYSAMTITVYVFAVTDNFSKIDDVIPWGFVNIRYWSQVATWLLPLFPLFLLMDKLKDNKLWRVGVEFTAAIWWWILLMSSSRGSILGIVFSCIVVWLFMGKTTLPWIKTLLRFAFWGMLAWLVLSLLIPSIVFDEIQVRGIKSTSSGRWPLWQEAWAMSLQNFPLGMGSQAWLWHDTITDTYEAAPKFGHPHNMYLMWAAEYGWLSIMGLGLLCACVFRNLLPKFALTRAGLNPDGGVLIAFLASVSAALFHAGVSAVFLAPGSMLIGLLILSLFWAISLPDENRSECKGVFFRFRGYGLLLVLAFVVFSGSWFFDVLAYEKAMESDWITYQKNSSNRPLPRFWFHGNFPRHASPAFPER